MLRKKIPKCIFSWIRPQSRRTFYRWVRGHDERTAGNCLCAQDSQFLRITWLLFLNFLKKRKLPLELPVHPKPFALFLLAYHACLRAGELCSNSTKHTIIIENVEIIKTNDNTGINIMLESQKHYVGFNKMTYSIEFRLVLPCECLAKLFKNQTTGSETFIHGWTRPGLGWTRMD